MRVALYAIGGGLMFLSVLLIALNLWLNRLARMRVPGPRKVTGGGASNAGRHRGLPFREDDERWGPLDDGRL